MNLNFIGNLSDVKDGIFAFAEDLNYSINDNGLKVEVLKGENITVEYDGDRAKIIYKEKVHFFRCLSILISKLKSNTKFIIQEDIMFDTNGVMFDVSRNAVFKVDSFKYMLRKMALMGLNMAMLYTEDTYQVKKYPFFGYMRGGYSETEIKEIDDYAYMLGIELIPCIQTLGHLRNVLKWGEMSKFRDTEDVLLCEYEETYELIEEMIASATKPYRSKRIHIGMDEAHSLGLGRYLNQNGYKNGFEIISKHLIRVVDILKKYDLRPMIWSDMYFRLASKSKNYYDTEGVIPQHIIDLVPAEIELVYWDYYHVDENFYKTFIQKHMQFNNNIIFAGGLWTWISPAMHNGEAFRKSIPALKQCQECGVKEVFTTLWGDNGAEANMMSALLGLQMCAEFGYSKDVIPQKIYDRFEECVGESAKAFLDISLMDVIKNTSTDGLPPMEDSNFCKYLLYQDPLLGIFDNDIEGIDFTTHFKELAEVFAESARKSESFKLLFESYEVLSDFLSIKADLGKDIYNAYRQKDKNKLFMVAEKTIPLAIDKLENLKNIRRKLWLSTYKPFGYEIIDIRLGGINSRLQTTKQRILDYLAGNIERIEELDVERLPLLKYVDENAKTKFRCENGWQRIISVSAI